MAQNFALLNIQDIKGLLWRVRECESKLYILLF